MGPDGQTGVGVHALLHTPQAGHALRQLRLYDLPCMAAPFRHCCQYQSWTFTITTVMPGDRVQAQISALHVRWQCRSGHVLAQRALMLS